MYRERILRFLTIKYLMLVIAKQDRKIPKVKIHLRGKFLYELLKIIIENHIGLENYFVGWREKRFLSVWFVQRLCLGVKPLFY